MRLIRRSVMSISSLLSISSSVRSVDALSGPIQIGLTGSIGMGKSTITNHFKTLGFGVFDADAVVHSLYGPNGEAVPLIAKVFPDVIVNNAVDRTKLASYVLMSSEGDSPSYSIMLYLANHHQHH